MPSQNTLRITIFSLLLGIASPTRSMDMYTQPSCSSLEQTILTCITTLGTASIFIGLLITNCLVFKKIHAQQLFKQIQH